MTLENVYSNVSPIINEAIQKEWSDQGHRLTGALNASLHSKIEKNDLVGYAIGYAKDLEEGLKPDQISFKVFPQMVRYFKLRGLGEREANKAAGATIATWMREGMSTQAAKRFSSTGEREHAVEQAFNRGETKINGQVIKDFDLLFEEHGSKSETV